MRVTIVLTAILVVINFSVSRANITKYVSPTGKGSGESTNEAADFLNSNFWSEVKKTLKKEKVTVKFMAGDYVRAYIEAKLEFKDMGDNRNTLILEGENGKTIFTAPTGYSKKNVLIDIVNSENIIFRNFNFTGNGSLGYALRIRSTKDAYTKNISIENCHWTDMRGIIYGGTGAHQEGTSNITYKNCSFKRVGVGSHSHFMYHSYYASNIRVIDCQFEDCTGDYVRFRAHSDYGTVENCTFSRTEAFPVYPFISLPLFNDVDPGDETFASHYTFTNNTFTNNKNAIAFHHYGFNPKGKNYLLTEKEGNILTTGTAIEKRNTLKENFGIDSRHVVIKNNTNIDIENLVVIGSFPKFGAISRGWKGFADLSELFK